MTQIKCRHQKGGQHKGFSLIELLVVVAIILIIAAIAIPNLLRAKISANEGSAVSSLRTVNEACTMYLATYGSYPTSLMQLQPATTATSAAADLIDPVLATASKSGYNFVYTATAGASGAATTYTIRANPITRNLTGQRFFFADQSGVIRQSFNRRANSASSPIG